MQWPAVRPAGFLLRLEDSSSVGSSGFLSLCAGDIG